MSSHDAEPVDIAWPTPRSKMDDSNINIPLISLAPIVHCLAEFTDELSRIGVQRAGAAGYAEDWLGSSPPRRCIIKIGRGVAFQGDA